MNYSHYRRKKNSSIGKKIKDYIVPIIGVVVLVGILVFFFWGGEDPASINRENQKGMEMTFDSEVSAATIVYPGENKVNMEGTTTLYKGETLIVSQGSVTVKDGNYLDFRVNKLGELKYLEDGNYEVSSGEVWLNTTLPINVKMNFANVKAESNTHLSMAQNEMGSTVYLISGMAEVSNNGGQRTVLAPGEKITVGRSDASSKDVDLSLSKDVIDQFFVRSDWYILNKGASFSGLVEGTSGSGTTNNSGNVSSNTESGNSYLTFSNLIDGSNVSSSSINISGTYSNSNIAQITVNGVEATINNEDNTFRIEDVSVAKYENDLIFKVLDNSNDVLSKFVYTVYYNGGTTPTDNSGSSGGNVFGNVQTYDVDGSQFTFTEPTTGNQYTTSESFVTIRGNVMANGITKVTVNGYTLSSFNGSTWRYHASNDNNNLAEGTNVYEINYYSGDNIVYTNYYTIIKKSQADIDTENTQGGDDTITTSGDDLLF